MSSVHAGGASKIPFLESTESQPLIFNIIAHHITLA